MSTHETTDFSLCLNSEFIKKIERSLTSDYQSDQIKIVITLSGEISDSKEILTTLSELKANKVNINFSDLPIDKSFDITIQVFINENELILQGISRNNTVRELTKITVNLTSLIQDIILIPANFEEGPHFALINPFELSSLSRNDFYSSKDPNENEENGFLSFSSAAFDSNGDLWMIKQTVTYPEDPNQGGYSRSGKLCKRILIKDEITGKESYDFIPVELQCSSPASICIDSATNNLIIKGSEFRDGNSIVLYQAYTINTAENKDEVLFTGGIGSITEYERTRTFYKYSKEVLHSSIINNNTLSSWSFQNMVAYNNILYLGYSSSGSRQGIDFIDSYIFAYDMTNDTLLTDSPLDISEIDQLGRTQLYINDLKFYGNNLYVLLDDHNEWPDVDESSNSIICDTRGALLKLNTNLNVINALGFNTTFTEENKTVSVYMDYGNTLYTDSSGKNKARFEKNINLKTYKNTSTLIANNFFGPKKFLLSSDNNNTEILFTDSGYMVYENAGFLCYKPVQRIATINCNSFSIETIKNHKVTFSTIDDNGEYFNISVSQESGPFYYWDGYENLWTEVETEDYSGIYGKIIYNE